MTLLDALLSDFRWYRELVGGVWYKVQIAIGEQRPSFWQREISELDIMRIIDDEYHG